MQASDFISIESSAQSVTFEKIDPIESNGSTSECFVVKIDGVQFFMKRLKEDEAHNINYRNLFKKEYEIGSSISNPNLTEYISLNDDENGYYILMEYICGKTLEEVLIDDPQYFSRHNNADKFFTQLLDAIDALHSHNVVYSDLKPSNIMISQVNHNVKLIDLGFCFVDAYSRTVGTTQRFAAPEHNDISQIDVTTDIYCIGRLMEYIDDNSATQLPKKYRAIMKKCLQPDKNDRYQHVGEIKQKINSHRKRNIIISTIVAITILIIGQMCSPHFFSSSSSSIWEDTLTLNHVKYSHFNEIDATCEIVGASSTPNIYFEEKVKYGETFYTVTRIADSAFYHRNDILTLHIPFGIKHIGKYAFINCNGLTAINMPNSIEDIGPWAFWGCDSIKSLKLSSNLKEIPTACFAGFSCKSLTIPDGIERINIDAFSQNDFLQSVTLPSTLKILERGAFFNNHLLKEVTLPANLKIIGEYIFFDCENLSHIYNLSPIPQQISPIHRNPSQITLHVPAESVDAYKNAPNWQKMNIVAIEEK